MKRYNPKELEPLWQKTWDEQQLYKADLNSNKPKYMGMSMFNYPSGAGIHIGHAMNYTISDVMARFKRQQGYESYHPVGWDSFGLPAENYAIKAGVSPQQSMATIIPSYHKQYKAMGWSNDWSKEIATHLPEYYKWTQWIFSEMYREGLAYQDSRMQWWCEKCQTVLANEQITTDGKCWRHDGPDDKEVDKKEVKQWFFKITEYADELLDAIDDLDWPNSVKLAQKNWIGRSVGAEVKFQILSSKSQIEVFTTRIDTIYGVTFLVLAPEHELVSALTVDSERQKVEDYVKQAIRKSDLERQTGDKDKTGVFTGSFAINPANGQKIPIWVADYVLPGYGTGAIMGVPAHDQRDNEFANKYSLEVIPVVGSLYVDDRTPPKDGQKFTERDAVQVIIKHPEDEKYLILEKLDWDDDLYSFVNGGVEPGESYEAAAHREIAEESGYNDYGELTSVGEPYFVEIYHQGKGYNVRPKLHTFALRLNSLKSKDLSEDEKTINKMHWVSADEVVAKIHGEGATNVFKEYLGTQKPEMVHEGLLQNSDQYNGISSYIARDKILADFVANGHAREKTQYKILDWSVSRQRYWGAPIPIINCPDCGNVLVRDEELPVVLPELEDFQPSGDGRSALARATDWLNVPCPECGKPATRETDTLDTYICSSWYMMRYLDPANSEKIFDSEVVNRWMPVDFYNGADHATAHMIYARFITRFFHKKGLMSDPEPFKKFLFNGKVMASDGQMFSKSKGNGVDPLEIIASGYGADALRTYLMFAAPLDLWVKWDAHGVPGCYRFLSRLWNLVQESLTFDKTDAENREVLSVTHRTIQKVSHDIENQKYNTAISAMMACVNELYKLKDKHGYKSSSWVFSLESIVQLVAPFAPHIAEQLWQDLGRENSVNVDNWPVHDPEYLVDDQVTVVVQVNGKVRAEIVVSKDISQEELLKLAQANQNVQNYLENKEPTRVVYVPGRLINIVV